MVKKGDTLIEVMLAVGIFSMIAISIAAVMSNGTSGAQTALESTIAREEIDTQAEALRFIHSAYIADKNSNNPRFIELWKKITEEKAIQIGALPEQYKEVLNFAPLDCRTLYQGEDAEAKKYAFIINPRMLGSFTKDNIGQVLIGFNETNFQPATTYPRLIFGTSTKNSEQGGLAQEFQNNELFRAEGIYIIAVKDKDTTTIVGTPDSDSKTSAFYDFYIRTCWYGSGSDEPSTISTVIRLYDPAITSPE